jgi:hypothetical protein
VSGLWSFFSESSFFKEETSVNIQMIASNKTITRIIIIVSNVDIMIIWSKNNQSGSKGCKFVISELRKNSKPELRTYLQELLKWPLNLSLNNYCDSVLNIPVRKIIVNGNNN